MNHHRALHLAEIFRIVDDVLARHGSSIATTTLGIYGHILGEDARKAVEKLGQILFADVYNHGDKVLPVN